MRVLLTNDDGFYAQGIKVLKDIVSHAFTEVWISAPLGNCSGMSRSITVNSGVTVRCVNEREYTVDGTPVDSAVLGLLTMRDVAGVMPDLVLSGINHGSNVGSRVLYSGTIAAAAASAAVGIPSIAISQEYQGSEIHWGNSEKVLLEMIESFLSDDRWNRKSVMSINIPYADIKGTYFVEQGEYCPHDGVVSEKGEATDSIVYTICDLNKEAKLERFGKNSRELLREGYIIVTPVGSDLTDHQTLAKYMEER